jgi:hypothetical protein
MMSRAFSKHLRKNPMPDEDILAALLWVERMVSAVRGDTDIESLPVADDMDLPIPVEDEDELTRPETDLAVIVE